MESEFLNAERLVLKYKGWKFDPYSSYWFPPK